MAGGLASVGLLAAAVTGAGERAAGWALLAVLVSALVVTATGVRRR